MSVVGYGAARRLAEAGSRTEPKGLRCRYIVDNLCFLRTVFKQAPGMR